MRRDGDAPTIFAFGGSSLEEVFTLFGDRNLIRGKRHVCCDRGNSFHLKRFLNDGAPLPKTVGNRPFFFSCHDDFLVCRVP